MNNSYQQIFYKLELHSSGFIFNHPQQNQNSTFFVIIPGNRFKNLLE